MTHRLGPVTDKAVCAVHRCLFEEGAATFVVAHMRLAAAQKELSPDLQKANSIRPKLLELSNHDGVHKEAIEALQRTADLDPVAFLEERELLLTDETRSIFCGKVDDRSQVVSMLRDIDWTVKQALAEMTEQRVNAYFGGNGVGAQLPPDVMQKASRRRMAMKALKAATILLSRRRDNAHLMEASDMELQEPSLRHSTAAQLT